MYFYLPYCLHISGTVADGVYRNGDGSVEFTNPLTQQQEPLLGRDRPIFDTMCVVANEDAYPVSVKYEFRDADGLMVPWNQNSQPLSFWETEIPAKCSLAMSLVRFNPFPDPPTDFIGRGLITVSRTSSQNPQPTDIHVRAYLGGGRDYPHWWNEISLELPVFKNSVPQRSKLVLPYIIQYRDMNHDYFGYQRSVDGKPWLNGTVHEDHSYTTGLAITNYEQYTQKYRLRYTVNCNPGYLNPGEVFTGIVQVDAENTSVFNLFEAFPGYTVGRNSEGHLVIEPVLSDGQTVISAKFGAVALATNIAANQFGIGVF